MSGGLHAAARRYAPRTIPLLPGAKRPAVTDWPAWPATSDTIDDHWSARPDANVGVRTGGGLVVLDVDPRHGGGEALAELEQRQPLPQTPEVATGGGGRHLYFRGPRDLPSFDLGPGLEVKAAGRQVVAPPSLHPSGRLYVWHPGRHLDSTPWAVLPAWIAARAPGLPVDRARSEHAPDELESVPAAVYVPKLTGRSVDRGGYVRCPFHGDGEERTPSLKTYDTTWACFACPPQVGAGRTHLGGGIYTLAALLGGYPLPLRGADFLRVRGVLTAHLAEVAA